MKDRHSQEDRRFARHAAGWDDAAHGHGRGGPHGERHGRHGRGRMFDHGELRLLLLAMIADQPRHGYELIKAIEERVGGGYSPSPGVVYPTLTQLEDLGHAQVQAAEAGRKLYAATDLGREWLAGQTRELAIATARLDDAVAAGASARAPQIVRAMENLKLALRLRLGSGTVSGPELDAIAAVLDGAATAVEKARAE